MAINTPPVDNSRITIRLAPNNLTSSVNWISPDGTSNPYGDDGYYKSADIVQIPNTLGKIETLNPEGNLEIGPSTNTEIVGAANPNGGVFISAAPTFTLIPNTGVRNTLSISNLVSTYMTSSRGNAGLTLSMIMHGEIDPTGITYGEYKYISRQDTPAFFDVPFYKESAYISFHSNEALPAVAPSIGSLQFSLRKGFHHGIVKIGPSQLTGLSLSNVSNGDVYLTAFSTQTWDAFPDLIAGTTCIFNQYSVPTNETTTATSNQIPANITCSTKTLAFIGIQPDGNAMFKNTTATSLFSNGTYQHNGKINYGDPDYGGLYGIPSGSAGSTLTIRPQYSPSFGSKNLLAFKPAPGATRLFGGTSNIGIVVGSNVQISGFPTASNNGIYQVLAIYNGIAGDTNENTSQTGSLPPFQYLELSRSITPENNLARSTITVRNVTSLPVLHIKYT